MPVCPCPVESSKSISPFISSERPFEFCGRSFRWLFRVPAPVVSGASRFPVQLAHTEGQAPCPLKRCCCQRCFQGARERYADVAAFLQLLAASMQQALTQRFLFSWISWWSDKQEVHLFRGALPIESQSCASRKSPHRLREAEAAGLAIVCWMASSQCPEGFEAPEEPTTRLP